MKNTAILGAGSYGEVFLTYLQEQGKNVVGFFDDNKESRGKKLYDIEIIGDFDDLINKKYDMDIDEVYCPIGDSAVRVMYLEKLESGGFETPNFIHCSAILDTKSIQGKGIYILPGVLIMPHVTINDYVTISMGSKIAHHTQLGKGVFISTGVNIGASVHINERAFLGISSTVMTGVSKIGKNALVGCGAVVIKDVEENHVVAGVPAKTLRILTPQNISTF